MTTLFDPEPAPQPLVSIIMPAHNAARFIAESIQSVIAQTYPHWELLIIDDASSDNTDAVVSTFTSDKRIRYHRKARIGSPAGVRNVGLRLAKGEFIAFLDADDLYCPDALEKLSKKLLDNPQLCAAYGFSTNMDEASQPLPNTVQLLPKSSASAPSVETTTADDAPTEDPDAPYILPAQHAHTWLNIVTSRSSCQLPGLMLRKSTLDAIGLFNETLAGVEDYEFYLRLYLHNYKGVLSLNDYVYRYRIHAGSLTKAPEHSQRLLKSCIVILDWLFNETPLPAHVQAYRSLAYVFCYRYMARERLLHKQPALARQLAWKALQDKNITFNDFIRQCGPLLIRSFLPSSFDHLLVTTRSQVRAFQHRAKAKQHDSLLVQAGASS